MSDRNGVGLSGHKRRAEPEVTPGTGQGVVTTGGVAKPAALTAPAGTQALDLSAAQPSPRLTPQGHLICDVLADAPPMHRRWTRPSP